MALLKYSAVVGEASGKAGGVIFSRNKGGNYIRGWSMPTDPRTSRQLAQRAKLSLLTNQWSNNLTEANRQSWVNSAELADHQVTNRFGEAKNLSGFQYFIKMNLIALTLGEPILLQSPGVKLLPMLTSGSVAVSATTGLTITLTYDDQAPFNSNEAFIISMSSSAPAGRKPGTVKVLKTVKDVDDPVVTVLGNVLTMVISPADIAAAGLTLTTGGKVAVQTRITRTDYPWDALTGAVTENSTVAG